MRLLTSCINRVCLNSFGLCCCESLSPNKRAVRKHIQATTSGWRSATAGLYTCGRLLGFAPEHHLNIFLSFLLPSVQSIISMHPHHPMEGPSIAIIWQYPAHEMMQNLHCQKWSSGALFCAMLARPGSKPNHPQQNTCAANSHMISGSQRQQCWNNCVGESGDEYSSRMDGAADLPFCCN